MLKFKPVTFIPFSVIETFLLLSIPITLALRASEETSTCFFPGDSLGEIKLITGSSQGRTSSYMMLTFCVVEPHSLVVFNSYVLKSISVNIG